MTDLLKHNDRVIISGYVSNVCPESLSNASEQAKIARIISKDPSFSWITPSEGQGTKQDAYHILVSDSKINIGKNIGNIWDTGIVESEQSSSIYYKGRSLKPNTLYFWKVKVYTSTLGESEWSDTKAFYTGNNLNKYGVSEELLVKSIESPSFCEKGINFFDFGKDAFAQLFVQLTSNRESDTVIIRTGEKEKNNHVDEQPGGTIRFKQFKLCLQKGTHLYYIKIPEDERNTMDIAIHMLSYIGEVMPFRYVEILNYNKTISKKDIFRKTVNYPFDETASSFHCNNDTLNQIWDFCKYTMKATSFTGMFVDGDRERRPYEADLLINQLSYYAVDREFSIARKSLEYILNHPTWPSEWIIQGILVAWYDYLYTGDFRLLEKNYDLLKRRTLIQLQGENKLISTKTELQNPAFLDSIHSKESIKDIVDWPECERDGFVFCNYNTVVNAFYYEGLKTLEKIALVLGKKEEASFLKKVYEQVYSKFNNLFFDPKRELYKDGNTTNHTSLHANMFAYVFGLVPHKYQKKVLNFIAGKGMTCSVYGAQFLMDALYEGGKGEYAEKLLSSTTNRSWYNMIRSGSTIAMEAWDIKYKPNLDWNHAWGAAPCNIITRDLLGIQPLSPAFGRFVFKPHIYSLTSIESTIPTIRGTISINYKRKDQKGYRLKIGIPANTKAEVYLPIKKNEKIKGLLLNGIEMSLKRMDRKDEHLYFGTLESGNYSFDIELRNSIKNSNRE